MNELEQVIVEEFHDSDEDISAIEVENVESVADNDGEENTAPTSDGIVEEKEERDELSILREELALLRKELEERDTREHALSRMKAEIGEFTEYFPEVKLDQIPEEVWEKVRSGASLAAQYALIKYRNEQASKRMLEVNQKNRKMSSGSVSGGEGDKYFSPSEVRKMSPTEVKKHYDDIIESMRHWN